MGIVGVIVLSLAGSAGASKSGSPAAWVSWVKIALGVLLLVAARQFRARPHGDEQPQMPKRMAMRYLMLMWADADATSGDESDFGAWAEFDEQVKAAGALVLNGALTRPRPGFVSFRPR